MTYVIPTSAAEHLAVKLEDFDVIFPDKNKDRERFFPDGEIYIALSKIDDLKDERVLILHSGQPNPNDGLIELEMLLQKLNKANAKIEIFFIYFPYGMQDKEFMKGEINVAENLIKKLMDYYNIKKIYIIDAHFWGRDWVKNFSIANISTVSLLKRKAEEKYGEDVIYITPDLGAERRTGIRGAKKERIDSYTVKLESEDLSKRIKGKVVGVIDDIVETGGTMCKAYDFCKENGAGKVIALITHGVLPSGISRIKERYDDLYLANTIDRPEANMDVTELISNAIK